MQHDLVVFPSSYLEVDSDGGKYATKAVKDFISDAHKSGARVTLAAPTENYVADSQQSFDTNDSEDFRAIELCNGITKAQSRLAKLFRYLLVLTRILFRVPRSPLWYIFIPSHVGTLAGLVRCLQRKPYGLYVRGEWPKSSVHGWLHNMLFRRATFIIATGESFARHLENFNSNVEEVAPMMRFNKQDLREKTSYKLGSKARILFVGALWPEKGVLELIQATSQVAPHHPLELQIVGTGDENQCKRVDAEIRSSGCSESIETLGFISNKETLKNLFTSADIFAFPTYYVEGFPRVIYEAMTHGLPIISTDFEGGRHLLRDKENCRLVSKRDAVELAECLLELLSDEPKRTKLGEAGLQDARKLYQKFEGKTHGKQVFEAAFLPTMPQD